MELPREYTTAKALLSSPEVIQGASHGKHVRQSLGSGWTVLEGADCWQQEFAPFIAGFFDRCSPLIRILRKR
jgi:tRNA nucleotidyltransferase (CCA-adding enzyme)